MLNIYTKKNDIPQGVRYIDYNDIFFDSILLNDDEISKQILAQIDSATYSTPHTFIGRDKELGNLNKNLLSTGCKTLLNITTNPDICFDVVECGQNVLELLPIITDGHILWRNPALHLLTDIDCDICVDGIHFEKFNDVMGYLMK